MLRSAFRGKQAGDSTTKHEKEGKNAQGKSHFFFHRENGEQLASRFADSREDQHISNENLRMVSAEGGVEYINVSDGELYLDCNHEFLEATHSSGSDKDSANEEEAIAKCVTNAQSGVNAASQEMKDHQNGSFSSSERQIYEMQLAQLQEQLVNTMIDYQDMGKLAHSLLGILITNDPYLLFFTPLLHHPKTTCPSLPWDFQVVYLAAYKLCQQFQRFQPLELKNREIFPEAFPNPPPPFPINFENLVF